MKIFLDASVLLAASGSTTGASREIFRRADVNRWELISAPYAIRETARNLPTLPASVAAAWEGLRPKVTLLDDILTLDRPVVFPSMRDHPILFSALAWSDVLLTLDRGDFGMLMGGPFYGLIITTPGRFLEQERAGGRLI